MLLTLRYRWFVLILCAFANIIQIAANSLFSTILPLVKAEMNLSYTEGGLFATAYLLGYTLGQLPWGYVADRFGGGKVVALSTFGVSAATFMCSTITGVWSIIFWRLLAGTLAAGIFASSIKVIAELFPTRRATGFSIIAVGQTLGNFFAGYLFPAIAIAANWRVDLWFFPTVGFGSAAASWVFIRNAVQPRVTHEGGRRIRAMLLQPSFWLLGFTQFVRLGMSQGLAAWLNTYLVEQFGVSLVSAGVILGMISAVGLLAPVSGVVSDRFGELPMILLSFTILVPCLLGLSDASILLIALMFILFSRVFNTFLTSPQFALIPKMYNPEIAGRAIALQNTLATSGSFSIPLMLGYSRDATGSFSTGWIALAGLSALGVTATLLFRHLNKKSKTTTQ